MKNLKKYILIAIVVFTCFIYVGCSSSITTQNNKTKNENLSTTPISSQNTPTIKSNDNIPKKINNIGLITSISSQAYTDFYAILDYTIKLLSKMNIKVKDYKTKFYSASMGGSKCTQSIIDAIKKANHDTEFQSDILVISRGGGSIESMWCFNNEQLAEAIYNSKIPVLSAVGHERDFTLCDKAAGMRASTPSHAGMMIAEYLSCESIDC